MPLKRKTPETLAAEITIEGQGEEQTFAVVYNNRNADEVAAFSSKEGNKERDTVLYIINSWDTEFDLTPEGVDEALLAYPYLGTALLMGLYRARAVSLKGN